MRGLKNKLAIALVMVSLAAVTACGNSSDTSERKSNDIKSADKQVGEKASSDGPLVKFAEPVTLTTAKVLEGDVKFKEGESIDDNIIDRSISEDLNINMKYLWTASSTAELAEKIRLALSANQELQACWPFRTHC